MPLVKAFRALLLLVAFLAIVPAQAGGALAIDEPNLKAPWSQTAVSKATRDDGSATAASRTHFVAPDDGTAMGASLNVMAPVTSCAKSPFVNTPLAAVVSGFRHERPPKTA